MNKLKQHHRAIAFCAFALIICVSSAIGHPILDPSHAGALAGIGLIGNLSSSQVRVIDPILSNVAQGYRNSELVGMNLFPQVPVMVSGGQIIEFGREAFKLYSMRRAPGGATKRLQLGYLGKPYVLLQDSLEGQVPREWLRDARVVPGIDLGARSVKVVMKALQLGLERDQAVLATTAGNYGAGNKVALAGATKWSASTGTPLTDVDTAREAIRSACGLYPNVMLMSALAFNACKNNPNVVSRFQYNGQVGVEATQITAAMLAGLFNIDKVVVGKAISFTDANVSSDIWGNNVVLAYVPPEVTAAEEPSYGYTYTMEGNPMVEPTYWDAPSKSWIYPVNYERAPVLSGISSGYLIQTPA